LFKFYCVFQILIGLGKHVKLSPKAILDATQHPLSLTLFLIASTYSAVPPIIGSLFRAQQAEPNMKEASKSNDLGAFFRLRVLHMHL